MLIAKFQTDGVADKIAKIDSPLFCFITIKRLKKDV